MSDKSDPLADIRASFFLECEDLLESLQDGLQSIKSDTADSETINVVFRAVHSIKGGAGAFGFDDLVGFAHSFESVLDFFREEKIEASKDMMQICIAAADVLWDLVGAAQKPDATLPKNYAQVLSDLEQICALHGTPDAEIDFQPAALKISLDDDDLAFGLFDSLSFEEQVFEISFKPQQELYQTGNEPLFILRALKKLGKTKIELTSDAVPVLTAWDEDHANLSWVITIETTEDANRVHEVFDFVTDLCDFTIVLKSEKAAPDNEISAKDDSAPKKIPDQPNIGEDVQSSDLNIEPERQKPPTATVRVGLDKIDKLMNLVGELVINQSMLSQSIERAGGAKNAEVVAELDEFTQLTRDIQDNVMTIRAQPVKSLFQRMGRVVREASAGTGKPARLQTHGEMTEVDKTIIEKLAEPLTHLIRNAVDHGLEDAAIRAAAGKNKEGKITLSAAHQSGRVIIEVGDDGGGIDRDAVRKKGVEKGFIAKDQNVSNTDIDNLLFMPGFSTSEIISKLSGRGVGMDVVKTAIQSLGGRVTVFSTPGVGTRFTMSMPLTLAVLDAMVIDVAHETLVIPLGAITETLIIKKSDLRQYNTGTKVIEVREGFAPVIDLGAALGYRGEISDLDGAIAIVLGFEDGAQLALVVDRILDQRQVVIKGLQSGLNDAPGIAAATILGDGKIALILDPTELADGALSDVSQSSSIRNTG